MLSSENKIWRAKALTQDGYHKHMLKDGCTHVNLPSTDLKYQAAEELHRASRLPW